MAENNIINDIYDKIRYIINEYCNYKKEISSIMHIPKYLIPDLIAFKKTISTVLDITEEVVFTDNESELEFCKFSEKYDDPNEFYLNLFFKYVDDNNEILEIKAIVYYENYDDE